MFASGREAQAACYVKGTTETAAILNRPGLGIGSLRRSPVPSRQGYAN
jgi:hypothetical protein